MEKCIRKKSLRSFGRDLISECIESNEKDVILRCSDGEISFHRYIKKKDVLYLKLDKGAFYFEDPGQKLGSSNYNICYKRYK